MRIGLRSGEDMSTQVVEWLSPAPRDRWTRIYNADPTALPDQSPFWLDHVCALRGCTDASRYYRFEDGVELVLPMVAIGRRYLGSLPYSWGMGGALCASPLSAEQVKAVFDDLARLPVLQIGVWPNPLQGECWRLAAPAHAFARKRRAEILDLAGGFETVWQERITARTRNYFNRAEKAGVTLEKGNRPDLVAQFYTLYETSILRWAQRNSEPQWLALWRLRQADPLEKLERMAAILGKHCTIWLAFARGVPAAGIIVIKDTNAHYMRGAMDRNIAGPAHANEYLHVLAIQDACETGCNYYQMGESGTNDALTHFKLRFGAVSYQYEDYHLERLPLRRLDVVLRSLVKRMIGYRH